MECVRPISIQDLLEKIIRKSIQMDKQHLYSAAIGKKPFQILNFAKS